MCGIAGIYNINNNSIGNLNKKLQVFHKLQNHRGPDGKGEWSNQKESIGFAHQRLSIIDIEGGNQPMVGQSGNVVCYNGEIYNYLELKAELIKEYNFVTNSDTEVILAAYLKWGKDCVNHFRGMFAFALWDAKEKKIFCARDRFGIKPFYYTIVDNHFYFASEAKSLLPFLPEIETDENALQDYFVFQFCLAGKTLFKGVNELVRAHYLTIDNGKVFTDHYWEVYHNLDWNHTEKYFSEKLQSLIEESVKLHLRSDVPVGAYISGGVDSSIVASLAAQYQSLGRNMDAFNGKFELGALYDESEYARDVAKMRPIDLHELGMHKGEFIDNIHKIIYHLDYPVAGPGSFPQYMVSQLAAKYCKVVLGGQGGDEIFGGYTRYLLAYFEQCIKGAIEGSLSDGNFVVTYESIIPNLRALENYKPLMKTFWKDGLFGDIDQRYFRLINRAPSLKEEVRWNELGNYSPYETFSKIFNGKNVGKESYFDKMTHFDFKTLLPALLQVEDRMSMAHGLESRVPFLDHKIVEFAATMPANIKFKNGTLKKILINTMKHELPNSIVNRKNKMGFPVPLNQWLKNDFKEFTHDLFGSSNALSRPYVDNKKVLESIEGETAFGRKIWGLMSLEIWHKEFHDKSHSFKSLIDQEKAIVI